MWLKLRKQVNVEIQQLNKLVEIHRPLLVKCRNSQPDEIETSALATLLHSFYTGIENIFKRIAMEVDSVTLRGDSWHHELLDSMARSNDKRQRVISPTLNDKLKGYLGFRHVFRQAYSFQLRWSKMSQLVLECEETLKQLETELSSFFESKES